MGGPMVNEIWYKCILHSMLFFSIAERWQWLHVQYVGVSRSLYDFNMLILISNG